MRLLLLITDLELGGTPTVVRELAIRLRRSGVDVDVACLSKWGPVADQLNAAGVSVTALNAAGPKDLKILGRLIRLIREKQITTVFSFLVHANAMAAAASLRMTGVRLIQSVQTTQPDPRWHWKVQRLAAKRAEKLVVPSQSVADALREWSNVPVEKVVVIPNAIDPADWNDAQSKAPLDNPRPYPITFLGRLDPIKDVPTLVKAAASLGSLVHLNIHGEGADRSRIEQTIQQTNAAATMHGAVSTPQVALRESGLLVLPSLAEGFGLVLIEAMAAGVPVVATDVPGIRDVVRNEETGLLVKPGDRDDLAAAIRRIAEVTPLRHRLIEQGRADVARRFTWDSVLPQYRRLPGLW